MTTTKLVVVAGATGNLGGRIVRELLEHGAGVRALVRPGTPAAKLAPLKSAGADVVPVDLGDVPALTRELEGATCVVSALQGLGEVILGVQERLLDAAVAAHVPRFIPSDYSIDFTHLPDGWNRNLDLRREFHRRLDEASLEATSILNGAFMELLLGPMPLLDFKNNQVRYWQSADQKMDFTTLDNTAAFTAAAARDASTPRVLRCAGDALSPRELAEVAGEVKRVKLELTRLGSAEELFALIQTQRAADPGGETQKYPRWQSMQYMHNMFSGRAKLEPLDNGRYPTLRWTTVRDLLSAGQAQGTS